MHSQFVYNKVAIKNGIIGYLKYGQGHSLIMLPRYAATLYNWDYELIETLAQKFTVYLFDTRLIGHSYSTNDETIDGYVDDIKQAIDALELNPSIVAGWSFGGVVVQKLYKAYPENIAGLIMISSFPDPKYVNPEFVALSMRPNSELTDEEKNRLYQLMVSEFPSNDLPNRLRQNVLKITNYDFRYTVEAKYLHNKFILTCLPSTAEDLAAIRVPCLILNAKNDLSFSSLAYEEFIKNIPQCKLILYPRGGHLLIHHHGKEIAYDIINYFENNITK
ncbi:MAG: alpha/beta hydrolase [Burkholderiales bacterium]|nr:alpha/beta hydrolase [Burkholderiales bacterium]